MRERQCGQRGGLRLFTGPRVIAHAGRVEQRLLADLLFSQLLREHIEQFARELFAIQIHERQRCVSQRGALKVFRSRGRHAAKSAALLTDNACNSTPWHRCHWHQTVNCVRGNLGLVNGSGMHRNSRVTRCARAQKEVAVTPQCEPAARARTPSRRHFVGRLPRNRPVCARDWRAASDQPGRLPFARKLQRSRPDNRICKATHSRRRGDPVTTITPPPLAQG